MNNFVGNLYSSYGNYAMNDRGRVDYNDLKDYKLPPEDLTEAVRHCFPTDALWYAGDEYKPQFYNDVYLLVEFHEISR